ncbi:MAG: GGDEF domain-containing protein [Athalassotoga sp.]|uniref:GGDEF domain-containing protein n=1 Tax=Athalassotoga sp. TaxID=2022597 RepID=UPI003D03073F
MADEIENLKRENEHLKERIKWYESQIEQMETLINQYNELVRREFDNLENVVNKMGTHEVIDPVTRVYSRDHMLAYLNFIYSKAFEMNLKCALIFFDIDDFEQRTKMLEKQEIDILMREIGKFLKNAVRVPLDMVARIGVDEFLILVTETPRENVISIAKRINKSFAAQKFEIDGKMIGMTCTISVVTFPEDSQEITKLLDLGEKLLEIGKQKGKNMVIFSE